MSESTQASFVQGSRSMRPLLTVVIPSYNSEATLERALRNLIPQRQRLEVLIVNDGSKDRTHDIASEYAKRYPEFHCIDQENKGHGGAINTGLALARAPWFKVLDSDDQLDLDHLPKVLDRLEALLADERCDALICDFRYEYVWNKSTAPLRSFEDVDGTLYRVKRVSYARHFSKNKLSSWADADFTLPSLILMHALIYRTDFLRRIELELPEHVSYEDNLYVFLPQFHLRQFWYEPIVLYRYYIGREGQSVSLPSILKNSKKQLQVTSELFHKSKEVNWQDLPKALRLYAEDHAARMVVMSLFPIAMGEDPKGESEQKQKHIRHKIKRVEEELERLNPELWRRVKHDPRVLAVRRMGSRLGAKGSAFIVRTVLRAKGIDPRKK